MDSAPQIQLPNPQQAIFNSQSFQAPVPSSSSSFFSLKNIALVSMGVLIIGGVGMGVASVRNATSLYKKKVAQQSAQLTQILDEADNSTGLGVVGTAQASYDNPFNKDNSYQNPFQDEENPF
ncbi:MAG: hypothetical protein ABI425_03750 [Patescibacteria group bacterium]